MIDADVRAAVVVATVAADAEESSVVDNVADVCVTVDDDSVATWEVEDAVVCELTGVEVVVLVTYRFICETAASSRLWMLRNI